MAAAQTQLPESASNESEASAAWSVGSWWRVELKSVASRTTTEATLVVGEVASRMVTIGVDGTDDVAQLVGSGIVPISAIDARDLSFAMFGKTFQPIDPPLTVGKRWTTSVGALTVEAVVKERSDGTARIDFVVSREGTTVLTVLYDERSHFFRSIHKPGHAEWTVVERGSQWTGSVLMPDGLDLAFSSEFEFGSTRLAGKLVPPYQQAHVDESWNRLVLSLRVNAQDLGDYVVEAQPPAGPAFQLRRGFGGPPQAAEEHHLVMDPGGSWTLRHVAAGSGTASVFAWAYRERIVQLAAAESMQQTIAPHGGQEPWGWVAAGLGTGLALLALRLFSRLRRHVLQDHATRDRLVETVRQRPGITAGALRHLLEVPRGTLEYHLRILASHGVIRPARAGRLRGWYVAGEHAPGAAISNLVSEAAPLRRILEEVARHPGIHPSQLARQLGVHHSTVAFHVERLLAAGALSQSHEGRRRRLFLLRQQG